MVNLGQRQKTPGQIGITRSPDGAARQPERKTLALAVDGSELGRRGHARSRQGLKAPQGLGRPGQEREKPHPVSARRDDKCIEHGGTNPYRRGDCTRKKSQSPFIGPSVCRSQMNHTMNRAQDRKVALYICDPMLWQNALLSTAAS